MKENNGAGRPSVYSDEIAEYICEQLMIGRSLRQICEDDGMPHRATVIRWMGKLPEFATKCACARDEQADLMDDKIIECVDALEKGSMQPDVGRVILSALQWRASKLKPKKYGDKQIVDVNIDMSISDRLERASKIIEGRVVKPALLPVIDQDSD